MKKVRGSLRTVATVGLTLLALVMTRETLAFGKSGNVGKRENGKGVSFETRENVDRKAGKEDRFFKDGRENDNEKDRDKEKVRDEKKNWSQVYSLKWIVVVGIVLFTACYVKGNHYFYKRFKKRQEDKEKGRIVL